MDGTHRDIVTRAHYMYIAKELQVPCYCLWFDRSKDIAMHMNALRMLTGGAHVPKKNDYNLYEYIGTQLSIRTPNNQPVMDTNYTAINDLKKKQATERDNAMEDFITRQMKLIRLEYPEITEAELEEKRRVIEEGRTLSFTNKHPLAALREQHNKEMQATLDKAIQQFIQDRHTQVSEGIITEEELLTAATFAVQRATRNYRSPDGDTRKDMYRSLPCLGL